MEDNRASHAKQTSNEGQRPKKLYQKPAFRYEQVFETKALSCGKIAAATSACQASRKNS